MVKGTTNLCSLLAIGIVVGENKEKWISFFIYLNSTVVINHWWHIHKFSWHNVFYLYPIIARFSPSVGLPLSDSCDQPPTSLIALRQNTELLYHINDLLCWSAFSNFSFTFNNTKNVIWNLNLNMKGREKEEKFRVFGL